MEEFFTKSLALGSIANCLLDFKSYSNALERFKLERNVKLKSLGLLLRNSKVSESCGEFRPGDAFINVFAHRYCMFMFAGLYDLLLIFKEECAHSSECDLEGLVFVNSVGEPIHYLVKLHYFENDYYFDAYGISKCLEGIKCRYSDFDLSEILSFDPDEESVFSDSYSDMLLSCNEIVSESVYEMHGDLDADAEQSHCDLFSGMIALEVISKIIK